MKKSLEMLKNLDLEALQEAKDNGICEDRDDVQAFLDQLGDVQAFLAQLKIDFINTVSLTHDADRQAEDLLVALFKIAKQDFSPFEKEYYDKLLLLYDALSISGDIESALVFQMIARIDTIRTEKIDGMTKILINIYMQNITSALSNNKTEKALQACASFGAFLQIAFPEKTMNEIQIYLQNHREFKNTPLPPLSNISSLANAIASISTQDAVQNIPENTLAVAALSNGVSAFKLLMGSERVTAALENSNAVQKTVAAMVKQIGSSLPYTANRLVKATAVVNKMRRDCADCGIHLRDTIALEASKLPSQGSHYYSADDANRRAVASYSEIDVDTLADHLTKKTGNFFEDDYYSKVTHELKVAVQSYQATKKLRATLDAPEEANSVKKLENARAIYNEKETQLALKSNPDTKVIQFFKTVGYAIANFFSGGLVHLLVKGSPLMSPQQRLAEQTRHALRDSIKNRII